MNPRLQRIIALVLALFLPLAANAAERAPGGTAFLKSLLIPGWGQYALGRNNSALAFLGADLALIGGMLTLNSYGNSARDDYKALAAVHAGVIGDHSHDFYVDVGNWMNVDQYNERRLRDRDYDALYTDPEDQWTWDSDHNRSEMEKIRIRSDRAFNSIIYFVGGMVLNHVASAIHAGRMAARQREGLSGIPDRDWNASVIPNLQAQGATLRFTYSF
ncbi:MAG: hypothetical protein ACOZB3_04990 [Calditrichota bacterium]